MNDDAALDLANAWLTLNTVLPNWSQVRITLRRKRGQVLCTVDPGKLSRTGRTEAEAMRACADALASRR